MDDSHDRLIGALAANLRPIRRLPSPAMQTFFWLVLVVALGGALAMFGDVAAMWRRMSASPDMGLAALGSIAAAAATLLNFFHPFDAAAADLAVHAAAVAFVVTAAWALGGRTLRNSAED